MKPLLAITTLLALTAACVSSRVDDVVEYERSGVMPHVPHIGVCELPQIAAGSRRMSESELSAFHRGLNTVLPIADQSRQSLIEMLSPQDLGCNAAQKEAFDGHRTPIVAIGEAIYLLETTDGGIISSCTIERNGTDLFLLGCEQVGEIVF